MSVLISLFDPGSGIMEIFSFHHHNYDCMARLDGFQSPAGLSVWHGIHTAEMKGVHFQLCFSLTLFSPHLSLDNFFYRRSRQSGGGKQKKRPSGHTFNHTLLLRRMIQQTGKRKIKGSLKA